MSDMTIREAVGILSAVAQQHRAAKMLGEALKIGLNIEGIVKAKAEEKNTLEVQINKLHLKLTELGDEVEGEEEGLKNILSKSSDTISAAQEKVKFAEADADRRIQSFEKHIKEQSEELEAAYIAQKKNLEEERKAKEEELASIEAKLKTAKAELASIKERL